MATIKCPHCGAQTPTHLGNCLTCGKGVMPSGLPSRSGGAADALTRFGLGMGVLIVAAFVALPRPPISRIRHLPA